MSRAADAAGPVRIGLTGPIGCGKSTVAAHLASRGTIVIDADQIARQVTGPGEPATAAIAERFGAELLGPDGQLDRVALGRIVFTDPGALADLEAIVHPAVRPPILAALDAASRTTAAAVVLEAIRIVDGGYADDVDEIWVVACSEVTQRSRLAGRGLDPAEATRRMAAQVDLIERARRVATRVIVTDGDLAHTTRDVDAALTEAIAARG